MAPTGITRDQTSGILIPKASSFLFCWRTKGCKVVRQILSLLEGIREWRRLVAHVPEHSEFTVRFDYSRKQI